MTDRIAELYRLVDLATDIPYDGGPFVQAMAYPAGSSNDPRMPLMYAISHRGHRPVKDQTSAFLDKARALLGITELQ